MYRNYFKIFEAVFNLPVTTPTQRDLNYLGEGIKLVKSDFKRYKGDSSTYYYLYKNGKKLRKELFRKGGFGGIFKDGYCKLLVYAKHPDSSGEQCVIDIKGKIVYRERGLTNYFYLLGGVLLVDDNNYYNLKTGKVIVKGNKTIASEKYLFVQNEYYSGFEKGVYKIEFETGKCEFIK